MEDEIETMRQTLIKETGVDPEKEYGEDWYEEFTEAYMDFESELEKV